MRRVGLALVTLLSLPAAAVPPLPPPPAPPPPPPPLIIVFNVDEFTGSLFDRYRSSFTGGLGRLTNGTVFRNGHDEAEGESFGSMLKRLSPDSQHVVVSGDAAPAPSEELVDQRWSWNGRAFISDAVRPPKPQTPALANAAVARLVASPEPGLDPPQSCQAVGAAGPQFARPAGDYAGFGNSPALDGATLALAAGLIDELRLGRDRAPDVVSISLASTGKAASGGTTCVQLQSLDRDLGAFLDALDRAGLYYAVALSGSDSSGAPRRAPILLWRAGMVPTERLEAASTRDVAPTLAAMLGLPALPALGGRCLPAQGVTCPKE